MCRLTFYSIILNNKFYIEKVFFFSALSVVENINNAFGKPNFRQNTVRDLEDVKDVTQNVINNLTPE